MIHDTVCAGFFQVPRDQCGAPFYKLHLLTMLILYHFILPLHCVGWSDVAIPIFFLSCCRWVHLQWSICPVLVCVGLGFLLLLCLDGYSELLQATTAWCELWVLFTYFYVGSLLLSVRSFRLRSDTFWLRTKVLVPNRQRNSLCQL